MHNCAGLRRFGNRWSIAAVIAFSLGASGGCYKHVVGAEGVGSDRYDIYEPNLKDPDDSVLPKRQSVPTKTIPTKRAPEQ